MSSVNHYENCRKIVKSQQCNDCCDHENRGGSNSRKRRLAKIRYIGIEFDPTKIDSCEKEVNDALSQGYEPIRDVDTPRGLIMVLGMWEFSEKT